MNDPLRVNLARLKSDFAALWAIGGNRLGDNISSDERRVYQRQVIEWLSRRLDAAGIEFHSDAVGNIDTRSSESTASGGIIIPARTHELSKVGPYNGALGAIVGLECVRRLMEIEARVHIPVCLFAVMSSATVVERVNAKDTVVEVAVEQGSILTQTKLPIGYHEQLSGLPISAIPNAVATDLDIEMLALTDAFVTNKFAPNAEHPIVTFAIRDAGNQWPMSDEAWRDIEMLSNVVLNVVYRMAADEKPSGHLDESQTP